MSVKKDASGRRSVQVEIEVPGTPEEVWEAIATGPGVSSWFVPTELRDDGSVVCHMGPGMDAVAKTTAWEPPRRFAAESADLGPNAPTLATEWIVEARSGGTCVVRVVHSLFASADDWDDQLAGIESGWPTFFRILKLYLTHFRCQPCSPFRVMSFAPGSVPEVWKALTGSLGLAGVATGQRCQTASGAPRFAGVVEGAGGGKHFLLVRLDEPTPGIAFLSAGQCGPVYIGMSFYLYGDAAPAAAAREEPLWQGWMNQHFPPVAARSDVA